MRGEQKGFEKAAAKRTKRLKQTHERVLKEQAALEKIVGQVHSHENVFQKGNLMHALIILVIEKCLSSRFHWK